MLFSPKSEIQRQLLFLAELLDGGRCGRGAGPVGQRQGRVNQLCRVQQAGEQGGSGTSAAAKRAVFSLLSPTASRLALPQHEPHAALLWTLTSPL